MAVTCESLNFSVSKRLKTIKLHTYSNWIHQYSKNLVRVCTYKHKLTCLNMFPIHKRLLCTIKVFMLIYNDFWLNHFKICKMANKYLCTTKSYYKFDKFLKWKRFKGKFNNWTYHNRDLIKDNVFSSSKDLLLPSSPSAWYFSKAFKS